MSETDPITKLKGSIPPFVIRMDRIATTATETVAERAMLLASVRWVNQQGRIWASVENWANMAGVTVRTAQRSLRNLVARGLVRIVRGSVGGQYMTSEYEIVCLAQNPDTVSGWVESGEPPVAKNPDTMSGLEPRHPVTVTPTTTHPNPDKDDRKPRHGVTQSSKEQQRQQPTTGVVVALLSPELQNHPNATRERIAWIEREAPKMDDPLAWAAAAIRGAWNPPADAVAAKAQKKAERQHLLAEFDQMPPADRTAVVDAVRRRYPNMAHLDENHPDFRLAGITNLLKQREESNVATGQRID